MTTTMAKSVRQLASRMPRLAPIAAAIMLLASPACHADWRFQPALGLSSTYSDNVDLREDALAESQLITEVAPSFLLAVDSRRLKATASGQLRQFIYRDENTRPRTDRQHRYAASLQGVLVQDMLMVDANASSSQQSISAFGPRADTNPYSTENGVQVRSWSISPYLVKNFGQQAGLTLRYTRDGVDTGEQRRFGNSVADTLVFNLSSGAAYQTVGWGLTYLRQDTDNELTGDSSVQNLAGNLRYQLFRTFSLTARAGRDHYDFEGPGGRSGGSNWSTGFIWTPSQRTNVSASVGRQFFGNTASLVANVRSRRTVWSINYGDTITTSRAQFTLPAAIDTAALLDQLLTATIPDPVQRQLAVAAYMAEAGLPPSLSESINFLSNRYMRQKLLQLSSGFNWARSSAVVSLHASERTALSDEQSDSPLLGTEQNSLNDRVRQRGATAAWTYRINSRSSLVASASYDLRKSLSRDIESSQRQLRVGMNRKLGRHMVGTVDLRRRSGVFDALTPRGYTEHAITAAITMKL